MLISQRHTVFSVENLPDGNFLVERVHEAKKFENHNLTIDFLINSLICHMKIRFTFYNWEKRIVFDFSKCKFIIIGEW